MCIVIHTEGAMRTNIDIDDELMKKALKASGEKTKKGAVEAALRLRGKVAWEGNLDESRRGRFAYED
jgi:Arc/MetJ family transcription regulator